MSWSTRIGKRVKLSDLHVFLAVAQGGSMARAASNLSVSHPVVSRSVGQLEHLLGVKLFERTASGVELTDHGRVLKAGAHRTFEELRQTLDDLTRVDDPLNDVVRLGTTPALASSFVCALMERVRSRFPELRLSVVTGDAEAQLGLLDERAVDLLIHREFSSASPSRISFELLFHSVYVVAAGAQNALAGRSNIKLSELVHEPWILPPADTRLGRFISNGFNAQGMSYPLPAIATSALEIRTNLLRTGPYLTVLPDFWLIFPHEHLSIKRLEVDFPGSSPPVGLIRHVTSRMRPAVEKLVEMAREVASQLQAR